MIKTTDFVFCPPRAGKPNPSLPLRQGEGRERIAQAAQKGEACWYYAMNFLRQRVGKAPLPEQQTIREQERLISDLRKQHTIVDKLFDWRRKVTKDICDSFNITNVSKDFALDLIENINSDESEDANLLRQFCKQDLHDDLMAFVDFSWLNDHIKCDSEFITSVKHISPQQLYKNSPPLEKKWEELNLQDRYCFIDNTRFLLTSTMYGLLKSPWHPNQPIECLLETLQKHGPQLVKGHFGQLFYKNAPFRLRDMIAERSIFGWKPDSPRVPFTSDCHIVILVGVSLTNKIIYFIDPLDQSDPDDKAQRIYALSYDKFKVNLFDLRSVYLKNSAGERVFPEKSEYALYNPLYPNLENHQQKKVDIAKDGSRS